MKMPLNITLKYSIMNILTIKERIYLNARKRYNIVQKNNKNNGMTETTRQVRSSFYSFVLSFSG